MGANPNFDAIASSTRRYYAGGKFAQQVYNGRPFLKWLQSGGRVKSWDGGVPILEPLLTEENNTVQWQAAYSEMDFTPANGLTAAQFSPKGITGTAVLDWFSKWQNNGSAKVIDLWTTKVDQLKESFSLKLNRAAFTGDGTDPNMILGLVVMVATTGTYGGIARSGNTFWQSYVDSTAGALNEDDIRTGYYTTKRNIPGNEVDAMWTTQVLYQKYEQMVLPAYRTTSLKMGDLGINALQWNGVPVMYDDECQSGVWYFLNSNYLKLRPHTDANMDFTDRDQPMKQLVDAMAVYWYGSLTCSGCRYLGKLTARTA
jgi:hypothetical protein